MEAAYRQTATRNSRLDHLVGEALGLCDDVTRVDADELAGRLLAAELLVSSSYEVGAWGRTAFRAAAEAALRLHTVATSGDEAPLSAAVPAATVEVRR